MRPISPRPLSSIFWYNKLDTISGGRSIVQLSTVRGAASKWNALLRTVWSAVRPASTDSAASSPSTRMDSSKSASRANAAVEAASRRTTEGQSHSVELVRQGLEVFRGGARSLDYVCDPAEHPALDRVRTDWRYVIVIGDGSRGRPGDV